MTIQFWEASLAVGSAFQSWRHIIWIYFSYTIYVTTMNPTSRWVVYIEPACVCNTVLPILLLPQVLVQGSSVVFQVFLLCIHQHPSSWWSKHLFSGYGIVNIILFSVWMRVWSGINQTCYMSADRHFTFYPSKPITRSWTREVPWVPV